MILDVIVDPGNQPPNQQDWGTQVDTAKPKTVQNMLCEGVGSFSVQGWYYDTDLTKVKELGYRWFPMLDPAANGTLVNSDSDFLTNGTDIYSNLFPIVHYPYQYHRMGPGAGTLLNANLLNEANFNNIPGLGRALKFTFTIYDSRGIFPNGKTFTHIIYLDK